MSGELKKFHVIVTEVTRTTFEVLAGDEAMAKVVFMEFGGTKVSCKTDLAEIDDVVPAAADET